MRLRVSLAAGKLTLIPRVRNIDNKPFSFTISLRNYLSVSDIRFALLVHYLFFLLRCGLLVIFPLSSANTLEFVIAIIVPLLGFLAINSDL